MMANAEETTGQTPGQDEAHSMEEILQSIRGVIAGEDVPAGADDVLELTEMVELEEVPADNAGSVAAEPAAPETSILDDIDAALDNGAEVKPEPSEQPEAVVEAAPVPLADELLSASSGNPTAVEVAEKQPDIAASQTSSEADMTKETETQETVPEQEPHFTPAAGRLIAEEVAKESSGSLQELVNTVHEKGVISPTTRGGTSLEELVIEAMKPFLADWLNKNLPVIVKKIVEKEVKHLIPKEED